MTQFHTLIKNSILLQNLEEMDYVEPTDIQKQTIPLISEGKDIFGIAQTGTGKTASFCLPLIDNILNSKSALVPQVLILVPTRELCIQINDNVHAFGKGTELKSCAIYGGVKQIYQAQEINQGVHFIVATPGRLLDLLRKELVKLETIETLILDEADRMLDQGFIGDLNHILTYLPKRRQALLYSATVPDAIRELSKTIQHNPHYIEVTKNSSVNESISHFVLHCESHEKLSKLKELIMTEASGSVLIFTNTKTTADDVALYLNRNHIEAQSVHSDKKQTEREKWVKKFSEGKINILVTTDLVSRGIDVETVEMVINFDIPAEPESYVHRIGRTGRAGRSGKAYSLCAKSDLSNLKKIEELVGLITY